MSITPWIVIVGLICVLIVAALFLAWVLGAILQDYFSIKWEKQFQEDLVLAVKNSQPTWNQIIQIAASRNVKNERVYWILQRVLREILTGRNADLVPHKGLVEDYISKMKEAEPFEGMPKEIRIHLERLREQLPAAPQLMEPLTSQIRELLSVNEREQKQQKYYTVGGFFLGIVGFLFAGYAYFYPYQAAQPISTQSTVAPEVTK